MRAAFPRGLEERVAQLVFFNALHLEGEPLDERLYVLLEKARRGSPRHHSPIDTPAD